MANVTSNKTNTQKAERRTAEVIHYTLSYMVQGEEHGPDGAIVLLHDIPAGAFTWEGVMPQLASLGRAVYAIDMLGFGESDHPWPADTSVWGQADALLYLLQQLHLTNVVLVGHGFGGGIAQILATRLFREETRALILIDTICYQHAFARNWPLADMEKSQDLDAPKQIKLEDLINDLRTTLPSAAVKSKDFSKVINNYVNQWNSELGKEVLLRHINLLNPVYVNSVSSDLRNLGKPALIIWGEKDEQNPIKYAHRLNHEMADSKLVIVSGAGHIAIFDAPGAVANAIGEFVQGL